MAETSYRSLLIAVPGMLFPVLRISLIRAVSFSFRCQQGQRSVFCYRLDLCHQVLHCQQAGINCRRSVNGILTTGNGLFDKERSQVWRRKYKWHQSRKRICGQRTAGGGMNDLDSPVFSTQFTETESVSPSWQENYHTTSLLQQPLKHVS